MELNKLSIVFSSSKDTVSVKPIYVVKMWAFQTDWCLQAIVFPLFEGLSCPANRMDCVVTANFKGTGWDAKDSDENISVVMNDFFFQMLDFLFPLLIFTKAQGCHTVSF